ncbi:MAG: SDR family oxidoreductase [Lachnospiraceae bacterium]|nr:SDR family oxidoreductase [Lachnospiraceae bacterium]
MKRLEDKVCIVTGASSGIGKATAELFAAEGAKLAVCARTESKLMAAAETFRACGAKDVLAIPCDVGVPEQLENFFLQIKKKFGRVDVLVNNAQASDAMIPFMETSLESLQFSLKSGLFAPWSMMQLCFPLMKEHGGSIINFSSASINGTAGFSAYAAAKGAISALSRVVANEWGQYNIRVNILYPLSLTDTAKESYSEEIRKNIENVSISKSPLKRVGDAKKDIAPVVLFLASDESRWITGQEICAEGGANISR